jgi:NAD(P)-dependent dehydrogenase (short-subunit alcohol dehydrogenase family)
MRHGVRHWESRGIGAAVVFELASQGAHVLGDQQAARAALGRRRVARVSSVRTSGENG